MVGAVIDELLTGLRIGAIILWAWLAIRVLVESWHVTEAAPEIRGRGWFYWRTQLFTMAFVIVFLFSPANILRANGYISEEASFWMMAWGTAGIQICAILNMIGLDVATGHPNRAWPTYVAIGLTSLAYGLTVHSL